VTLGKVDTKSDVNAPTVLTLDSPSTSPPGPPPQPTFAPTVVEKRKPEPPPAVDASMTVVESASLDSSATAIPNVVPRPAPAPQPVPAPVPAPVPVAPAARKKSHAGLIIGVIALLLVLGVVGVASIFLWKRSSTTTPPVGNASGATTTTPATAGPTEISRYWLELVPKGGGPSTPFAGLAPIASGQSFRFHLVFSEAGYVYIFGPGDKNQPTAFLTTKPLPDAGVTTNQVSAGSELAFPQGNGNKITLDKNPGTDVFTIIFAKTELSSPAFLNQPVTGQPLSASEQAELTSFVSQYSQKPPVTEPDNSDPRAPLVRVKVPAEAANNPIVFNIRIQHN
jgi:hypothetical protein